MEQGIKGIFQGVAPVGSNSTIIVTNYEREAQGENHVYFLREFMDQKTKVLYRENAEDNTLDNPCPNCAGPGNQTMFAQILNTSIEEGKTHFNFIPLLID